MEMKVINIRYEFAFKDEEFGKVDIASLTTDLEEMGYVHTSVNRELCTVSADLPFSSDTEGKWLQTEDMFRTKYGLTIDGDENA